MPVMHRKIALLLFSIVFLGQISGQDEHYPPDYFRPPLDGRLLLSGTFGELRSNHFHSGIDIKTGGVEGKEVFAIADGYVSRIKISTGGYGKAIYITHPNGYVSVYGHLQKFNNRLQKVVTDLQYERESFTVETFPKKGAIEVRKGEIIAYSGNTGGSSAPHLHFEIREEASQHPVNPLLFKSISVKDMYRPKILEVGIYPVDRNAMINGENDTVFYRVAGWGVQHYLQDKPRIEVSGNVSFGIRTHDAMNDTPNKNGIYQIDFFIDTSKVFGLEMNKTSFATTRYLNSLIDYNYYKSKKRRLIRTQVDTNNRLFNYRGVVSNGVLNFSDSAWHEIQWTVKDVYSNTSQLLFDVVAVNNDSSLAPDLSEEVTGTWFEYSKQNKITTNDLSVTFPANSFYQSFSFQFDTMSTDSTLYAPIYQLHNRFTPVHKSFTIIIKPRPVTEALKKKLYIAYINKNGGWYIGSKWEKGALRAKSRILGGYSVKVDTINPKITPVNIVDGKNVNGQTTLKIKIRDRETGIKKYWPTLNGDWILMEYDPKKRLLVYYADERLLKGENEFKLVVTDLLGNETTYEATLIK